jgi:hypothetical protein
MRYGIPSPEYVVSDRLHPYAYRDVDVSSSKLFDAFLRAGYSQLIDNGMRESSRIPYF